MRYLYTTTPDEGCREVSPGVYGRPVHTTQQAKLKKLGWVDDPSKLKGDDHVREEKEVRQESEEVTDEQVEAVVAAYTERFGRKPHHKMKLETMLDKLEQADD